MTGPPPAHPDTEREDEDDADVITQSLDEPELFAGLYDRHAPDIHRYAARRLGEGAADDITAETFLIAFRTRDRYDTAHRLARPWLYGIAANLIGKHRRTEVRALKALARTGHDPVAASWSDRSDDRLAVQAPWRGRWPSSPRRPARPAARRLGGPRLPGGGRCAADTAGHGQIPAEPGPPQGPRGTEHRPLLHLGARHVVPTPVRPVLAEQELNPSWTK